MKSEKVACPCRIDTHRHLRIRLRYNVSWTWGCALCGVGWTWHERFHKDRLCYPELAAVYRVGGAHAVLALLHAFPDKYPRILKRMDFDREWLAKADAKRVKPDKP